MLPIFEVGVGDEFDVHRTIPQFPRAWELNRACPERTLPQFLDRELSWRILTAPGVLTCCRLRPQKHGMSNVCVHDLLVGGLEHFLFFHILGIINQPVLV